MAEGKGFRVIVKINLPPEENYHSGHSVIFQGDAPDEVEDLIAAMIAGGQIDQGSADQARFILLRFTEFASGGAAKQTLRGAIETSGEESAASAATPEPQASSPDLASKKVLEAVSKKTGKALAELEGMTKATATEMLKGGK